jgi:hypothetical protein
MSQLNHGPNVVTTFNFKPDSIAVRYCKFGSFVGSIIPSPGCSILSSLKVSYIGCVGVRNAVSLFQGFDGKWAF